MKKSRIEYWRTVDKYKTYEAGVMVILEEEKRKRNIWNNNDSNFPHINIWNPITDQEDTRNTRQNKCQTNKSQTKNNLKPYIYVLCSNYRESKKKDRSWKKPRIGGPLSYEEVKIRITSNFFSKNM